MAGGKQGRKDVAYEYHAIAAERLAWVMKPIFLVAVIAWIMSPGTVNPDVVDRNTLLGFLLGALFGILLNADILKHFLVTRRKETRHRKNRVPEEYYFGRVMETLQKTE